jgi:hypothetical protein
MSERQNFTDRNCATCQTHIPMRRNSTTILFGCIVAIVAVAALGCRGRRGVDLPTARVSGVVTYQGKPLGFGRVTFFHPSGHAVGADIAADGSFALAAYQGNNSISVECYDYQMPGSKKLRSRMGDDKCLIPARYLSYGTSGLTFVVKPDEENKAAFALKD